MAKKDEIKRTPVLDGVIDLPDIPMPMEEVVDDSLKDECVSAVNWAFIGSGQAGSRICSSYFNLGYRRVCCINTSQQDLHDIKIPEKNKFLMDIGEGGSAKNPEKGAEAIKKYFEDVYDLMKRSFGDKFERILVLAGCGGGTGSGSMESLINAAHDIAQSFKLETKESQGIITGLAVGALVSLPMASEGVKVNANSYKILESLFNMVGRDSSKLAQRSLSPLIIVDNDKINKLYPNLPVTKFWEVANQSITSLFHLFNNIAVQNTEFTTFDKAELDDMLSSGVITFGACQIKSWKSETDISFAIRDNLRRNVLVSDLDFNKAKKAACIFVAHPEVLNEIPQSYLEHGFEMLSRIMKEKSVVHRGIYKGNIVDAQGNPGIRVYTILGELGRPEERMKEMARIGGVTFNK